MNEYLALRAMQDAAKDSLTQVFLTQSSILGYAAQLGGGGQEVAGEQQPGPSEGIQGM